jgi:hypothetical protein
MFRKFVVTMTLALCAATAFAGQTSVDTSGLTEAQIAELKAIAAQKVAEAAKPATAENITAGVTLAATWGTQAAQAAEGFAKAMGIAAKELNVSINDFLASDAGKLTAVLIIWKVAGTGLVTLLYGAFFVTTGLIIARVIYMRLFTKGYEKVEYSRFGGFFKGTKLIRIPKPIKELDEEGEWLMLWTMIIIALGSILIGGFFLP